MEAGIKENLKIMKYLEKEYIIGKTEKYMKENGEVTR